MHRLIPQGTVKTPGRESTNSAADQYTLLVSSSWSYARTVRAEARRRRSKRSVTISSPSSRIGSGLIRSSTGLPDASASTFSVTVS